MPIIILFAPFIAMAALAPIAIQEDKKVQQVNELCIQKFNTPEEIKACKTVLMKVGDK